MQMKIVKKQILRVVALVMAVCLIAVCFAGCGKKAAANPYKNHGDNILGSQPLASNDNYELLWDQNAKAVRYMHKNGKYWSDILYESYLDGSIGTNGSSPLSITVIENKTLDTFTITSASVTDSYIEVDGESVKAGNIYCGKIEGGIRVYYFFNMYKVAVPVDYVLKDDHIEISVDTSAIMEDGTDYTLISVGFQPNFCSVKNGKGSNLFVPTGTGAVMNCLETSEAARTYEGSVYGRDITNRIPIDITQEQEILLPVFGAYDSESGLFAVIESGVGSALLKAEAGNDRTGYSSVYPEFYVRGSDTFMKEYYGQDIFGTAQRYNDDISGQTFKVSYYPLFGDESDYNGMAKKYQSYLVEKGELAKSNTDVAPYSVTFWGGTNTTQSFFGIPYKRIDALTTFTEAQNILATLKKDSGVLPQVRLLGYSDNGLRPGSIAGGSSYPSVYGSKKELKSLIDFCKGTNLFLDFDIVTYSKSGNGFSLSGDVAETAIGYKAESFPTTPTRQQDKSNPFYALGRKNLAKASEKALKKADKYSAKALSFSTLGEYAYSDYTDNKYINRNLIETDAKNIIASAKKEGYVTAVAGANGYAASAADVIFDAPINAGEYNAFSYDVPFYQMVFSSYKPMYTVAVNSEINPNKAIATAAVYGMGIGYTITNNYVDKSDDLNEFKLYATIFEDNASKMKATLVDGGFIKTYNMVKGASLDSYKLSGSVAKSTFSNGVVIYANLSNTVANSPVGKLQPYEYKLG